MKVLVTGATGFVGGNLARQLRNHGYEVRALVRPGKQYINYRRYWDRAGERGCSGPGLGGSGRYRMRGCISLRRRLCLLVARPARGSTRPMSMVQLTF